MLQATRKSSTSMYPAVLRRINLRALNLCAATIDRGEIFGAVEAAFHAQLDRVPSICTYTLRAEDRIDHGTLHRRTYRAAVRALRKA